MRTQSGIRALPGRLLLAVALGAIAVFAIPAIGSAHKGHHHGTSDPAGTVKSFDSESGLLTVDLNERCDISAHVNRRTKIRCDEDREHHRGHRRHHRRHGDHASVSDSGRGRDGSEDSGDERGRADEPGEDNHEHGANEPGEDHHGLPGDDDDHGHDARCSTSLVEGAIVARAEIDLEDGNAFFEKIVVMPAAG
jgi:hypothetical protein